MVLLAAALLAILLPQPYAGPGTIAPASQFVFAAAGDFGAVSNTDATLTAMRQARADFHVALGDLSYNDVVPESTWCSYVKARVGATFPFELVAGNHEDDGPHGDINKFAACLPDRLSGLSGKYAKQYYFDYQGLARIILISPNLTIDGTSYEYVVGSSHYTWLVTAIDEARGAGIPWVIVGMHKPCISVASATCVVGTDLMDLLVSRRVDLVLQAHEHGYQRSKHLRLGPGCPTITITGVDTDCIGDDGADGHYTRGAGTVFVTVGTGGKGLGLFTPGIMAGYFTEWMRDAERRHGFLQLTVSDNQIVAEFVGSTTASTFTDTFAIR